MKNLKKYALAIAGFATLAAAPAMFAYDGDMRYDYRNLGRQNADIRHDRRELREDMEDGRYWRAARERADLRRDYFRRNEQIRDIRRDNCYRYGRCY